MLYGTFKPFRFYFYLCPPQVIKTPRKEHFTYPELCFYGIRQLARWEPLAWPAPLCSNHKLCKNTRDVDQQGVLTVEPGGHLGSLMTQFAILYSLCRRDGKHAFLPAELEIPLRKLLSNL